jgi:hypothetical protein
VGIRSLLPQNNGPAVCRIHAPQFFFIALHHQSSLRVDTNQRTDMKTSFFVTCVFLAPTLLTMQSTIRAQATTERALQELFQTETVYSQEKGETQLTFASRYSKNRAQELFQTPLAIEYGLTDRWQVTLEWSPNNRLKTQHTSTRGIGDLTLGTKYSWMNVRHSNFHLAAGVDVDLPTASVAKELGEGKVEFQPYMVVARDFPGLSHLQIFSQLGVTFTHCVTCASDGQPAESTIELNSGMFIAHRQARFVTEINWSKGKTENALYLTPGIVFELPHSMEVGVGIPLGLTRDADRVRAIVKLVYEFGGARKPETARR